jgi:hypothetical protein
VRHLGERLSAFIDGELGHQQRERVLAHLARCEPCRREATALRLLKRRMHALGEATADTALTDRLIAVAGVGAAPWDRRLPSAERRALNGARRRWPARSLAVAGLTLAGLGVPAAAFLAGGGPPGAGPTVTPAIDTFVLQHEISNGSVPVMTQPPAAPGAPAAAKAGPVTVPAGLGVLSAAGAAVVSARVASALVRVAAASTRVAAASLATSAASRPARHPRPHPVVTATAGAR